MDDLDRYGDYNEIDDEPGKGKNPAMTAIKILIVVSCLLVVGVLAFRMILFNYYPSNIKNIYYTESLTELYEKTNGEIGAKTQSLRSPYDDPDKGHFFADNMIVIPEIGEIQFSLRYNTSALDAIKTKYEIEELDESDFLEFRLTDNYGKVYDSVSHIEYAEKMMYRYIKLVFDGIDFEPQDGNKPEWIRLEIFVKGHSEDGKPFGMIPVYENHKDYNLFVDYKLKKEERP